jgi:hypothetical protein
VDRSETGDGEIKRTLSEQSNLEQKSQQRSTKQMRPNTLKSIRRTLVGGLSAVALSVASSTSHAAPITEEAAHAIGMEAYVYFYPLLSMDVTRKQFTNIEAGKEFGKGPMNMFVNIPEYPPADFKGVVRSNFDTLYFSAWLDLTKEPMIVSAPDTDGRYYLLPMLDMWTDVFASPGWRTTGTKAGNFLVTPPGWTGTVPECMTELKAPHPISGPSAAPRRTERRMDAESIFNASAAVRLAQALSDNSILSAKNII